MSDTKETPAQASPAQPITPAANIDNDNLVRCLMSSAVAGWQLYAMSRNMFDALPTYTEAEKKAYFATIANQAIADKDNNMIPFRPLDTIEVLKSVVMPFWLAKVAAEKEVEAYRNQQDAAAAAEATTVPAVDVAT